MVIWTEKLQVPGREASACVSESGLFFLLPPRWQDSPPLQYLLNTHLIFLPKAQQQCGDITCGCDWRVLISMCQQPPHIDCGRSKSPLLCWQNEAIMLMT